MNAMEDIGIHFPKTNEILNYDSLALNPKPQHSKHCFVAGSEKKL